VFAETQRVEDLTRMVAAYKSLIISYPHFGYVWLAIFLIFAALYPSSWCFKTPFSHGFRYSSQCSGFQLLIFHQTVGEDPNFWGPSSLGQFWGPSSLGQLSTPQVLIGKVSNLNQEINNSWLRNFNDHKQRKNNPTKDDWWQKTKNNNKKNKTIGGKSEKHFIGSESHERCAVNSHGFFSKS